MESKKKNHEWICDDKFFDLPDISITNYFNYLNIILFKENPNHTLLGLNCRVGLLIMVVFKYFYFNF